MTPCRQVEVYRHFGTVYCLHLQGRICGKQSSFASCLLSISSTMKMEVIRCSETTVSFYLTTRRHIPEDAGAQVVEMRYVSWATCRLLYSAFLFRCRALERVQIKQKRIPILWTWHTQPVVLRMGYLYLGHLLPPKKINLANTYLCSENWFSCHHGRAPRLFLRAGGGRPPEKFDSKL
jgi:hypothetical protein